MPTDFLLAHISDLHLGPLPEAPATALLNKRVLGYLSWQRKRRHIHQPAVLEMLRDDLKRQAPDHIAVTGDLVNLSLPAEFRRMGRWLEGLGAPETVSVVPGNHDAYVALSWQESWAHWAPYMTCEAEPGVPRELETFDGFPYLRRRGPLALVGLSTAHATPPLFAHGSLGRRQIEALGGLLDSLGTEGLCRVILLHHPPYPGGVKRRKSLWDVSAFRDCVARHGAELVLHGHTHRFQEGVIETGHGAAQVFGVPSASAGQAKGHPLAHYHLYRITQNEAGWSIALEVRGYDPTDQGFAKVSQRVIPLGRASEPPTSI